MNKNKLYLVFIMIFTLLLTGCSASYNLNISDNVITEELIVNNYDSLSWNNDVGNKTYKDLINETYKTPIPVLNYTPGIFENTFELEGYDYYKKTLINSSNNYGLILSYSFNKNNYEYSTIVNNSYNVFNIDSDNNSTIITVYGDENIFETYNMLDEIQINITLPYNVTYSNSDKVSNNTYTWIINKENVSIKQIMLKYEIDNKKDNNEEIKDNVVIDNDDLDSNEFSMIIVFVLLVIVIVISFIVYKVLKMKFNNNNQI